MGVTNRRCGLFYFSSTDLEYIFHAFVLFIEAKGVLGKSSCTAPWVVSSLAGGVVSRTQKVVMLGDWYT